MLSLRLRIRVLTVKDYHLCYRNDKWLYSVYASIDDEFVLVAVVPGVGWNDIAMLLKPDEIELLSADKETFSQFVDEFVKNWKRPKYKVRRIERRIIDVDINNIQVKSRWECFCESIRQLSRIDFP